MWKVYSPIGAEDKGSGTVATTDTVFIQLPDNEKQNLPFVNKSKRKLVFSFESLSNFRGSVKSGRRDTNAVSADTMMVFMDRLGSVLRANMHRDYLYSNGHELAKALLESGQAVLDRDAYLALSEEVGMSKQTRPICPNLVQLLGYSNLDCLASHWNESEKGNVHFQFIKFNAESFKEKLTNHFVKLENRSKVVVMDCLTQDWVVATRDEDKCSIVNGHYNKPVTLLSDSMIDEKIDLLFTVVDCI